MVSKGLAFILLLVAGVAPAVVIAFQFEGLPGGHESGWGAALAAAIAAAAPSVVNDAVLAGVSTPIVLAGLLAFLAPSKSEAWVFTAAIAACGVGWAAYLWLETVLADQVARDALIAVLDQNDGSEAAQRRFGYVANFATAGRLAFLALGATLLGVKLRPAAAVVALGAFLFGGAGDVKAGSLSISGDASAFEWSVAVRDDPDSDPQRLPVADGAYVFSFDKTLFRSGAYA